MSEKSTGKNEIRRIAVFCGSSSGREKEYIHQAEGLGRIIAERGMDLVYGGGGLGLMGAVAAGAVAGGGKVTGVIPRAIAERIGNPSGVTAVYAGTMHERKSEMYNRCDAVIALPGGLGTLEEIAEVLTWNQLGFHNKPAGFLNIRGFYDPLLHFLKKAGEAGFIRPEHLGMVLAESTPEALLDALGSFTVPKVEKWQ